MSPRTCLPLRSDDVSALAKSLRGQLIDCGRVPGHLELLNMLARAAGYKNFQHLRAQVMAGGGVTSAGPAHDPSPETDVPATRVSQSTAPEDQIPLAEADLARLRKLVRYFDQEGRLIRWPGKFGHTGPCLWVLWSRIEPRRHCDERRINEILRANHLFEDPALLRRELYDRGMLDRTIDCRSYRRLEKKPPPLALELIRRLADRRSV